MLFIYIMLRTRCSISNRFNSPCTSVLIYLGVAKSTRLLFFSHSFLHYLLSSFSVFGFSGCPSLLTPPTSVPYPSVFDKYTSTNVVHFWRAGAIQKSSQCIIIFQANNYTTPANLSIKCSNVSAAI